MQALSTLALAILLAAPGFASTIRVPADRPTIQAGIDAAAPGDTVLVSPGTYYENIDFKGKAITVLSTDGAAKTIIDGGAIGPVVSFAHQESRASTVSGFTIRNAGLPASNGIPTNTAGIFVSNSTPTILNNLITSNVCNGVYLNFGAPLIQGNTISGSIFQQGCFLGGGSGVFLGGGYYQQYQTGGGPVLAPTLLNNIIEQNLHANLYDGGGIDINGAGNPVIQGNIIRNNATTGTGGAIAMVNTNNLIIIQNLIYNNRSGTGGGGIHLLPPSASQGPFIGILANNTFVGNSVATYTSDFQAAASQVHLQGNLGQYVFVNNIVVGADSNPAFLCGQVYNYLSITPVVLDHNDIFNSGGPAYGGACPDQTGTYGNISVDPQFVSPAPADFHLRSGSPAIDGGNSSAPQLPATDLDNNLRIQDATGKGYPVVDMGVYESSGPQAAAPTFLTLTPSAYNTAGGTSISLTAKLISTAGTPTGSLTFFEDNQQIGVRVLDSNGSAVLASPPLVPGIHAFTATYDGQGAFKPAISVKFYILVDKYSVTLRLTSTPNPSLVGQSVTFTATTNSADNFLPSPIVFTENNLVLGSVTPSQNGVAVFATSALTLGTHFISASATGDTLHTSAASSVAQQVINGYPTPTSFTSSPNPAVVGQPVTFTAVTTFQGYPNLPPSAGTMTYTDGSPTGPVLAVLPITAQNGTTATTTFTTSSLSVGTHLIYVSVNAANGFSSAGQVSQIILGLPTTTTLALATPNPAYALQPVTLSASVSTGTATIATGTTTFFDGSTSLGTTSLNSAGLATLVTSKLPVGPHTLHAVYNGDTSFASSTSNTASETVLLNPASTTLSIVPNPSVAYQPIAFTVQVASLTSIPFSTQTCIGCTVTLTVTGLPANVAPTYTQSVLTGSTTFNFGLGLSAGTYTFSATFNGSPAFAASTSVAVQQTVVPAPVTLTLAVAPNPATQLQPVSLSATLTAPLSVISPVGTVIFYDGTTPLATITVAAPTGPVPVGSLTNTTSATITTSTLTPGTHIITASYSGSLNFLPATSAPITLVINPNDFTLSTPNPSITIPTEHHLPMTLNLASLGTFADQVALACTGLPAYATCTFKQNALALTAGGTATTTLTVDTDFVLYYAANHSPGTRTGTFLALLFPAGILGLCLNRRRRLPIRLALFLLLIAAGTLSLNGCSGRYPPATQPGAYTFNITGHGTSTGLTHAIAINLTVTP